EDPALQAQVTARLEKRKADLCSARAELLAEADRYKEHEPDIDFWRQEIDRTLEGLEFEMVPDLFRELEAAVVVARAKRDPIRLSMLEFLREAGFNPYEGATRDILERQVEVVKLQNQERRQHLLELEKVRDNSSL